VLNLGVSFSIASIVALRAYDVPRSEQRQILRFLIKEVFESPLSFLFPVEPDLLSITPVAESIPPGRVSADEEAQPRRVS
jgi:site-specific recombinase